MVLTEGKRALAAVVGAGTVVATGAAAYAHLVAPYQPRVVHLTLPVPEDAPYLQSLRIAFVTDTHVGPGFDAHHLEPIHRLVRRIAPHLLLLGGDYVSESPRFIARAVDRLTPMAREAPHGAYAVLGNHDMSCVPARVERALQGAGIPVLRNRAIGLHIRGGPLWIAGIDEALLGRPDPRATFDQIPPGTPTIVLWHESDFAESVARFRPLLQLSGHTHGGQVRLPAIGPLATPIAGERYVRGLYDVAGMPLYVSSGVGVYRPPVRLFCPPEVTLITFGGTWPRAEAIPRSALGPRPSSLSRWP